MALHRCGEKQIPGENVSSIDVWTASKVFRAVLIVRIRLSAQ